MLPPFTKYYIRKLLRQYVGDLNYPRSGVGIYSYFQTDLDQLLGQIYTHDLDLRIKTKELEMLVHLHQLSGTNSSTNPYKDQAEIEQKILWILNLKFLALLPAMALTITPEASTSLFHFVFNSRIHQGVRYSDELYGKVLEFGTEDNLQAYHLLFTLINQRTPFILTVSELCHTVWVSLRSPTYYTFSQPISQPDSVPMLKPKRLLIEKIA
ncbi:MAG: hypothetical protein HC827_09745 [Cyanobacteria bacterium RM1_2_2]|nr:hypothetical protein [Cyanobacteria bacterium RM1_2_2]